MAIKNKIIRNPKTGQDIRFLVTGKESDGQLLEMESTYNSFSKEPAEHYHPFQDEDFTVMEGELTVRIDGQLIILKKGDMLHIPKYTIHAMWNNNNRKTVVNWKVRPALFTDNFLETLTGLASDGKTNEEGMPGLLQVAMIAKKYSDVFRLSKIPFWFQKYVFCALAPVGYMFGYRAVYKKYID